MLVLTRKSTEQIKIGEDITITILRVKGNAVRVGVDAPKSVRVIRSELPPQAPGAAASADLTPATEGGDPAPSAPARRASADRIAVTREQVCDGSGVEEASTESGDEPPQLHAAVAPAVRAPQRLAAPLAQFVQSVALAK